MPTFVEVRRDPPRPDPEPEPTPPSGPTCRYSALFLALLDEDVASATKARQGTVVLDEGPTVHVAWHDDPASWVEPCPVKRAFLDIG